MDPSSRIEGVPAPGPGVLFVVTGPSGVGKTTLVRAALAAVPHLVFSVSATTRPPRRGERDGVDYRFVDDAAFDRLLAEGELLEWAEVYGHRYGTPRGPVEAELAAGRSVLLEIDAQGAAQVRRAMPGAVGVFIAPPSMDALRDRLVARGTDDAATVARRMREAWEQVEAMPSFDHLVVNADLPSAHRVFQGVLLAEMCRVARQQAWIRAFLSGAGC